VEAWGSGARGAIAKFFLGSPLKLWASVGHWALWHFDINKFTDRQKPRVRGLSLQSLWSVSQILATRRRGTLTSTSSRTGRSRG
jgi:hypothetical protein